MSKPMFNPMEFVVAESNAGGLPNGSYVGVFEGAEYLPAQEPDPMTGSGGRQWAKIVFKWRILEGEYKDRYAFRETPESTGIKSDFIKVCGLVMGKQLTAKDKGNLTPFIGCKYQLMHGPKIDKIGNPTKWTHVVNAMLVS